MYDVRSSFGAYSVANDIVRNVGNLQMISLMLGIQIRYAMFTSGSELSKCWPNGIR